MNGRRKRSVGAVTRLLAGALAALALVAACGSGDTGSTSADVGQDEASMLENAKGEKPVVWYCSTSQEACDAMTAAFEKKYPGVKAEAVRLVAATISSRFATEKQSKAPTADFIFTADYAFLQDAIKQGWTQPIKDAGLPIMKDYPDEWYSDQLGAPFASKGYAIAYNTKLVSKDEVPTDFTDLLDPKWKGKIVAPDPSASTGILAGYVTIDDKFGTDLIDNLLSQQKMRFISGGMVPTTELLAAGEAAFEFIVGANIAEQAIRNGSPIAYVYPKVTAGNPYSVGLNADLKSPNAARLFANFFLSEEGEKVIYGDDPGASTRWLTPDFEVVNPDIDFFTDKTAINGALKRLGLK